MRPNIAIVESPEIATTRFTLIRHAESEWNAAGRWQGHADPPLSARGRSQATTLAQGLAGRSFDLLITSDLQRAIATAEAVGRACGLPPRRDARFRELDVGRWTGLTGDEIKSRDAALLARFEGLDPDVLPGGGESRRQIRARVRGAVDLLAAQHPGQSIAIVGHLGVIRALLPGSEPGNAEWIETTLAEIRESVRAAGERGPSESGGPRV